MFPDSSGSAYRIFAIQVGAAKGAEWALNNDTYVHMNGWFHYAKLYAATAGCIGFTMLKYHWGIGKKDWFKIFSFAIVAINILIAVGSDFESGVALLLASTFAAMLWNKGGWIQNRANTLALWCMFAQVFPLFQEQGKFAVIIKRAKEQKKNPYTNEIFTDQRDYKLAMARAEKQ